MQVLLLSTSAAAAAQNAALTADWSIRTLAAILEAAIEATEGVGTDVVTIVTAVQAADVENQELQMKSAVTIQDEVCSKSGFCIFVFLSEKLVK